jgi:hypothetical protein
VKGSNNENSNIISGRRAGSPNELEFVQQVLSVWSNFVVVMLCPLFRNPTRNNLVLPAPWHDTMTILSFKVDQFCVLLVLFPVVAGSAGGNAISLPNELEFV